MTATPQIDADRLWQRLMALAEITESDQPWTRRSFTPKYLEGRAWLRAEFDSAGLSTLIDACGNLIGRRDGSDNKLAPLMIGSHSDTVPSGGRFDGILGVVCALEAAQTLQEANIATHHPLEVVDFLAEEPSEFGLSCIGSRALAGALTPDMLSTTRPDGMTLAQGIAYAGGDPGRLDSAARGPGTVAGYLEVHIEQARSLEVAQVPIGVVTGIVAIRRQRIIIRGRADHAGATPMALRQDALVAASMLIAELSRQANAETSAAVPLVATVGKIDVRPNASNVIPGEAELVLEARSAQAEKLDRFLDGSVAEILQDVGKQDFTVECEDISWVAAAPCDPRIMAAIETAAEANGQRSMRLPSGAGHDGCFVANAGPIGMIFVPCLDGRSHAPEEWAEPGDCAVAAQVMLDALLELDQQ